MFEVIPYDFYKPGSTYFWVHFGLVILGFLFAVATCIGQWVKPAPYGKHDHADSKWGPMVPQRLSHIISDFITGVIMFSLVFFLYSKEESDKDVINYIFFSLFLIHTLHRGLIHPLTMRYRSTGVAIGITIGGLVPNVLYHWLNADQISRAQYDDSYYYDPRFLLGILLYAVGFVVNRWADLKLRALRKDKGSGSSSIVSSDESKGYYLPYGGLFELVSCPNYFGELVQWIGWTLSTWSLAGLVWTLFCAATFFARSRHNHKWYREHFEDYPQNRRALIPFLF